MVMVSPMKVATLRAQKPYDADNRERIARFGPAPANPFKELRVKAGLSLGDVAHYSGVDRRALQRCEYGMYTNPLPNLIKYWVRLHKATEGELLNDYEEYQTKNRTRHLLLFGLDLDVDPLIPAHPFRQLRANRPSLATGERLPVGLTECCQMLCLPLDSIQFFEKKYRLQKSLPKNLFNVLNQIGYTYKQVTQFEICYKEWRERNKRVTFN
jgi:transcriptional regulator with XRE-family HTH domain